ncbi:MAG TPA: DUF308 domain-containing protein [Thermomicrobiales bacterium]|nr:DUF308 domain-containing protein [Thermomicrobiales bacterium]
MGRTRTLVRKGNPFRADLAWWVVGAIGVVALVVGIYILTAPESANRNIVFIIGAFLLINGLGHALAGFRARSGVNGMMTFLLVRAGIGIATGAIVVINRFAEFMGLDAARIVNAIGLLGMGLVTIAGMVMAREGGGAHLGAVVAALVLCVWGITIIYQVTNDTSSNDLLGWLAVAAGAVYLAVSIIRWRREARPVAMAA